jgi:hypothetical protein
MSKEAKYELSSAESTLKLANEVAKFIKENKLYLMVHGKPHINIEAWQYAAANLGIVPVVDKVENLSSEGEIKYGAYVSLTHIPTGNKVSAGYSVCSNKEPGKKGNFEFAICSMAQTRAGGKAYRMLLGWLIKAAGYEATPSEEMDSIAIEETEKAVMKAEPKKQQAKAEPEQEEQEQPKGEPPTVSQKAELLMLINNKVFTNAQKNKMIAQINTLNIDEMTEAIIKTRAKIKELQKGKEAAHA